MTLIKWEPFRDIERFFGDDVFPQVGRTTWDLSMDVYEDEKGNVVAELNVPGVDPDDIDISVEDDYLRVSGSRKEEKEQKKKSYYAREIRRGSFERTVRLPAQVKSGKTEAEYEDGVLTIVMPKEKEEKRGKVKVKVKKK